MLTNSELQIAANMQDFKDILSRVRRAEQYVENWHNNIEVWRKLYNLQHYNRTGKTGEVLYADPTYTNTVDLAVGIMLGNELRWHAFGFKPSMIEQEVTGKMEKLIDGTLQANSEREEQHQLYQLFQNFCRDGGGATYSVFDPDLANTVKDEVEDDSGKMRWIFEEVPVRLKIIDPLQIILLPGGPNKWLLMGRTERRSVLDIETSYNVKLEKYSTLTQDEKANTFANFYDVWDYVMVDTPAPESTNTEEVPDNESGKTTPEPGNRRMAIRNTRIFESLPIFGPTIMNGYRDLPYTVQFFKPVGEKSENWHSILSPLKSSIEMLERSFNRRAKQIDIYTALPLIAKTQPGRNVTIDPGLYNSISITPDEEIEFPRWPGNSPDVQQHMDMLRSRIQQSGFSDVMFGSGNNAVAGYALSQLGDQNRIRLEQPIQHLELLLTMWAKKTIRLLQTFAPSTIVTVSGHQKGTDYMDYIDMDEIKGFSIRAEIRPNFPNEEMRRVAMSTQVKGTVSDYTRMERYLGIEQPEDEQRRKLIEAAQNHPIAMQYALMKVLKEAADTGDEAAALTLQAIQQQGQLQPGQGRPDEPNNPEQPTGTASSTGQEPVPGAEPAGRTPIEQQQAMASQAPSLNGVPG